MAEIDYNALAAKYRGVAVEDEEEEDSPIDYYSLAAKARGVTEEDEEEKDAVIDYNALAAKARGAEVEEPQQEVPAPERPDVTSPESGVRRRRAAPPYRAMNIFFNQNIEKADDKTTTRDVVEDVGRVGSKFILGGLKIPYDLVDAAVTAVRGREIDPGVWASFARGMIKGSDRFQHGLGLSEEDISQIIDERGKIREVETTAGQVLDVAAFMGSVLGGKKLMGAGAGFVKEGAKWFAAGVGAGQVLIDPDANVGNLVESLYESDAPESMIHTIAQYLSADEDDTQMVKRIKLLGEEVLFVSLFGILGGGKRTVPWLIKKSRAMYKSGPWELTKKQKGEIAHAYLKEARDNLKLKGLDGGPLPLELVDEGGTRILQNADSVTRRFVGRFFTPGGAGLTKKAFSAFEDSQTAQRQMLSRATFLSRQLKRSLDRIGDADKSAAVGQRVQTALHSETDFLKDLVGEDRIAAFAMKHKLPDSVAAHTLEARELIDRLSKDLTTVRMSKKLTEIIQDNAGSYIRRSYRLFEDPDYVPSDDVRNTAIDYIANRMRQVDESLGEHTVLVRAANQVDKLLAKGDGQEIYDHIINSKRVAREILGHKKDIPQEIRALMGEIQDPSDNILLTVSKMSKLYETNRFFERFYALGKSGKYVVDADDMPLAGDPAREGWKVIKGTNSVLDGKHAPNHVVDALHEKDAHFQMFLGKDGTVSPWWRNFLYVKGASQSMKTVYSHVTHARNFMGGMQFATANGASPFSRESIKNFRILKQEVSKGGDKALQAKYEEFLELGIINTNVRIHEFRELLNVGSKSTFGDHASKLAKLGDSYGAVKRAKALGKKYVVDAPRDIYMATDDFFKINYYQQELRTLQRALPDEPIGSLKKQASEIVRDTFPNYDRVPRGIKAIRELPLGTFMAFPTEIMRTSTHIIRRASKEITSGSPVLVARGLRRLAGFATTTSGWAGASAVSAQLLGWTEEEAEAHHILSETTFSKDAPRIWVTTDDGIKSIDTQFLDSYSTIKEPLMAAYREIETGQLQGEALDEYLVDALLAASWKLLEPYASEAMLTEAFIDVGYAAYDPEGRLPSGKAIFGDKLDTFEKAWEAIAHIGKSLGPGSVLSAKQLVDAATGKRHRITGDTNDTKLTLITQATGIKYTNHEPADDILWAAKKWHGANFNASTLTADYEATGDDLSEHHYNIEKKRFEASQEFYRKINASIVAVGARDTYSALLRAKVSDGDIARLFEGFFVPRPLSINLAMEMYQKTPTDLEEHEKKAFGKMMENYADMLNTRLDQPFKVRHRKATGGIVEDVPNVPKEPDERIDKMTGEPYNKQAGGAFIDAEDPLRRLGFVGGGLAEDPLRRLGFVGGGLAEDPLRRLGFGVGGQLLKSYLKLTGKGPPPRVSETLRGATKEVEELKPTPITQKLDEPIEQAPVERADEIIEEAPVKIDDNIKYSLELDDEYRANFPIDEVPKFNRVGKRETKAEKEYWRELFGPAGNRGEIFDDIPSAQLDVDGNFLMDPKDVAGLDKFLFDSVVLGERVPPRMRDGRYASQWNMVGIKPFESVPRPATHDEMYGALDSRKRDKIDVEIPEGQKVGLRLDIPAYDKHNVWVPTIHDEGGTRLTSHRATAAIRDVDLSVSDALQAKAKKIKEGGRKSPFARIGGKLINRTDEENYRLAQQYLNDPEWTQVGFNPKRHSYFFDRVSSEPVIGGSEAIQVGPLVLVKNAKFGKVSDFKYATGGKVYNALRRRRAHGGLEEVSADVENSQGSPEEMPEPKQLYGKAAIAEGSEPLAQKTIPDDAIFWAENYQTEKDLEKIDKFRNDQENTLVPGVEDSLNRALEAFVGDKGIIDQTVLRRVLIGTAKHESLGGALLKQGGGGPARGAWQVEPATARDIIETSGLIGSKAVKILGKSTEDILKMDDSTFSTFLKDHDVNAVFAIAKYLQSADANDRLSYLKGQN